MKLSVRVVPQASQNKIVGFRDGVLRVKIAAPPVDGKANEELCRFLGKSFDLPPSAIRILGGQTSKKKTLEIPLTLQQLLERISD